jgi:hypothetical protein
MLQSSRRQVRAYPLKRLLWLNPAGQGSIVGCHVENSAAAATGRNRPKADFASHSVKVGSASVPFYHLCCRRRTC